MKKHILSLLLALFLLLPLAASAAKAPVLPDLTAFAGNLLSDARTEDFGFCKRVTLYGSKNNVKNVALAYIDLLLEQYNIHKHAHFTNNYANNQHIVRYALGYAGQAKLSSPGYHDDKEGWQISAAHIVLYYTQYDRDNYVQITYASEFDYTDKGDRANGASQTAVKPTATPKTEATGAASEKTTVKTTAKPTATPRPTSSSRSCTNCGGDGQVTRSCTSCGGDGDIERRCANCGGDGERDCISCSGKGYNNCSGCYGSGERRCGSCGGTGTHGSKRCTTCGGDGERRCTSCSGTGKKRCTGCSGTGDRRCTSCSGRGETESRCSACSGDGRRESSCTTCGGDGRIN
ncbi:MAG: hypothetical protein IJB81_13215 [Clostridia bacterium]|nr:hypothetical protein [Clostridia bacterium]